MVLNSIVKTLLNNIVKDCLMIERDLAVEELVPNPEILKSIRSEDATIVGLVWKQVVLNSIVKTLYNNIDMD